MAFVEGAFRSTDVEVYTRTSTANNVVPLGRILCSGSYSSPE